LLEHYDVPATVFLVTGYVGLKQEFWWDELERLLLQPGSLPETLRLTINSNTYEWRLREAARYSEDAYFSQRHSLYVSLWRLLRPLPESERRKIQDELLAWAGAEPAVRSTHRTLSREEVLTLGRGELIEIGSHTVTHPLLSALSPTAQREEIQRSKAELEQVVGRPVSSFSYPYGDYTADTILLVREAGFACACTTDATVIGPGADRFQLPRIMVENWDGDEFARRLSPWLDS
jgi:peptidoglycan/xylan/chitin deacetylase (PgdA/CDA1 family)